MKLLLSFLLCTYSILSCVAQDRYIEKKGSLLFKASTGTYEPIKATNESVTAILNPNTGEIASLALIKEFKFKNALMEEHFNENYIESDSYPKAIFKGIIENFNLSELTKQESSAKVTGILKLHGKEKDITFDVTLSKDKNYIFMIGNFSVTPEDFDIKIPGYLRKKVAENVKIIIDFNLRKKE